MSLTPEIYSKVRLQYKDLGFTRVSDLINTAVADFLAREEFRQKDQLMKQAAQDAQYLEALRAVSRDFGAVDSESWPDY